MQKNAGVHNKSGCGKKFENGVAGGNGDLFGHGMMEVNSASDLRYISIRKPQLNEIRGICDTNKDMQRCWGGIKKGKQRAGASS